MKEMYGLLGTAFMMGGFIPYLLALRNKTAKPHMFSWILWGLITSIVCVVQFTQNAGPGAWTTAIAAFFNVGIGIYAIWHGERNITRSDWIIFAGVLAAIPIWVLTKDPVISVVLVSILDSLGFIPTIRKSWDKPHEEVAATFVMGGIGFIFALMALDNPSFTNICYPVKVLLVNSVFLSILFYRRSAVTSCSVPA